MMSKSSGRNGCTVAAEECGEDLALKRIAAVPGPRGAYFSTKASFHRVGEVRVIDSPLAITPGTTSAKSKGKIRQTRRRRTPARRPREVGQDNWIGGLF